MPHGPYMAVSYGSLLWQSPMAVSYSSLLFFCLFSMAVNKGFKKSLRIALWALYGSLLWQSPMAVSYCSLLWRFPFFESFFMAVNKGLKKALERP